MVIEVDVQDDGHARPQRLDRPVGLVALDDQRAGAGAGVTAELRHLPADQEGRIAPELAEDERDHRGRGRLAVGAGDDDGVAQRYELGEELGAGTTGDATRERRGDDRLEPGGCGRFAPTPRPGSRPRARGPDRESRSGPSRRRRLPRHARGRRRRTGPRRRCPRTRASYPRARASAISSSAISSAASGRASRSIAARIWREPPLVVEQRADQLRNGSELGLGHHDRAASAREVPPRSSPGGLRSRTDTARGRPARPPPRAPRPCRRPGRLRGRSRPARLRTPAPTRSSGSRRVLRAR